MDDRVKKFFKANLCYLVISIVCAVYVATAILTPKSTGKTIMEIIADGCIAFMFGMFINRLFDLQGMMNGDNDERVLQTMRLHGEIVERISPNIDKLNDWCDSENKKAYKTQRTRILACVGLKYDDCFDGDGVAMPLAINKEKLKDKLLRNDEKHRIKTYKKAVNLKLTQLSLDGLTSEGGKQYDPNYLGRTKAQYEKTSSIKDTVSKIGIALIIGYYGVELIESFSYANLVWKALQVALFLIMGVIKLYQSYCYIVDEYRGRVIKKINHLQEFENFIRGERENVN